MANIVELRDSSNNKSYPMTKAEAVYLEEGIDLEENAEHDKKQFVYNSKTSVLRDTVDGDTFNTYDLPIYKKHYWMTADGTLAGVYAHTVHVIDGDGIQRIVLPVANNNTGVPLAVVKDAGGIVQRTVYQRATNQSVTILLFPGGLPSGSKVYFNGFNENKSNYSEMLFTSVDIQYSYTDDRFDEGKNKLNPAALYDGYGFNYSNGAQFNNPSTFSCVGIPVKPGDIVYYSNSVSAFHSCYTDRFGNYISGFINAASNTVPSNAYGIIVSILTEKKNQFYININENVGNFTKFIYKFANEADPGSSGFLPYFEGYKYFKFDTQQKPVFDGTTYRNTAYLKLPSTYTAEGTPTPLVVIVHGASNGISDDGSTGWTHDQNYNNIVNSLINAGYAVMDSSGFNDSAVWGHDHWGCPQALAGYVQAYDYVTSKYNLDKLAYVYGFSMGGLTALSLMAGRMIPMRCAMIASPVISLYNQCFEMPSVPNTNFLNAYNVSGYSKETCYGCDRYYDIVTVGQTQMAFTTIPPLYIAYGSTDTNVSNSKILEYYTALYNANKLVKIKSYAGGHEICYGGNSGVITDMINWFDAYNPN